MACVGDSFGGGTTAEGDADEPFEYISGLMDEEGLPIGWRGSRDKGAPEKACCHAEGGLEPVEGGEVESERDIVVEAVDCWQ